MNDVVIFDGMCKLCARCVRFILAHEADHGLRFTPGQSPAGARLMRELGLDPEDARTFVLISNGKAYVKSEAAVRVAGHLRGRWKLLRAIKAIPRPLRDWAYDLIARKRYRWFGRSATCMVPTPEQRARFLED